MSDMAAEIWLPIPDYEGLYLISNMGRVRAVQPYRSPDGLLKGDLDRYGYRRVLLCKDGGKKRHKVHRLVCRAFHGEPPSGTECGHRDGNRTNNTADNLAWITQEQNRQDAIDHGTYALNTKIRGRWYVKLSQKHIEEIREQTRLGASRRALAAKYDVAYSYIHKIVHGDRRSKDQQHVVR